MTSTRSGFTTRRATMSTRWSAAGSTGRGCARSGKLRAASWDEALKAFAEQAEGGGQEGRGDRRRPARRRDHVCGEEAARRAGVAPARRAARPASIMTCPASPRCASTRPSPGSRMPTRSCWSARTSAGKRRWSTPACARRRKKGAQGLRHRPEVADLGMRVTWLGDDLKLLGKLPKEAARCSPRPSGRR